MGKHTKRQPPIVPDAFKRWFATAVAYTGIASEPTSIYQAVEKTTEVAEQVARPYERREEIDEALRLESEQRVARERRGQQEPVPREPDVPDLSGAGGPETAATERFSLKHEEGEWPLEPSDKATPLWNPLDDNGRAWGTRKDTRDREVDRFSDPAVGPGGQVRAEVVQHDRDPYLGRVQRP